MSGESFVVLRNKRRSFSSSEVFRQAFLSQRASRIPFRRVPRTFLCRKLFLPCTFFPSELSRRVPSRAPLHPNDLLTFKEMTFTPPRLPTPSRASYAFSLLSYVGGEVFQSIVLESFLVPPKLPLDFAPLQAGSPTPRDFLHDVKFFTATKHETLLCSR